MESDLLRGWSRTGLRYSDLRMVVRDLTLRGRLELQTVGETTYLQIKNSNLLESDSRSTDLLTRALDWLALRQVRHRQRAKIHDMRSQRRASDHYE